MTRGSMGYSGGAATILPTPVSQADVRPRDRRGPVVPTEMRRSGLLHRHVVMVGGRRKTPAVGTTGVELADYGFS